MRNLMKMSYVSRRNESDINSTDNANALRTNMYDSLGKLYTC